jgi:hypothetical protein
MWQAPVAPSVAWTLNLSGAVAAGYVPRSFNQLFVNNKRATRAREPEVGSYFRMTCAAPGGFGWSGSDLDDVAVLADRDLEAVEVVVYQSWQASRRNVARVDKVQRTVTLTSPCAVEIEAHANSGSRFYAENFAAACDAPNEWFFDDKLYVLHYVPEEQAAAGEEHSSAPPSAELFVVPMVVGDLFLVNGTRALSVSNVTFAHVDWSIAGTNVSSGAVQAASFLTSSAVHVVNSSSVSFVDCAVTQCGEYGVWVEGGSQGTVLDGVFVSDTGAGGIRVGRGHPLDEEPAGA